jgi:hypothetical protein
MKQFSLLACLGLMCLAVSLVHAQDDAAPADAAAGDGAEGEEGEKAEECEEAWEYVEFMKASIK